jgi:SET domain-containing protein
VKDNKKVELRKAGNRGKGIFAKKLIKKGEIIASFDGPIYTDKSRWNDELRNHCIQFAKNRWRYSNGIARFINHSCEPNCGVKDLFDIVAMRDIKKDEELTWDYEMTESNPKWKMKCRCKTPSCRGVIGNYKNMPLAIRKKYKGFISQWLIDAGI